ncbi:MAG: FtsX-like permease family protein, partial [Candidatus Lokiarchaeota archaeon]|nr:FtsX-like permease family protein [Candidatus Lokiarchaeota archaeon]
FWVVVILIIGKLKGIKIRNLLDSGFVLSPAIFLIFYLLNKYILKITITTFGIILLSLIIIWTILTTFVYIFSIFEIEIAGILKISIKSIVNRKKRTIGTILGVSVGVALIIIPIPLISGYYNQIGELAGRYQYAEYLIVSNSSTNIYSDSYINIEIEHLIEHSNIEVTCPQKYFQVNISDDESSIITNFRGINYSRFNNLINSRNWNAKDPLFMNDSEIIMGVELASILNISLSDLPRKVNLTSNKKIEEVLIIGIFQTSKYYDGDVIGIYNLSNILNPSLKNYYSIIELKLNDYTRSDNVINYINENFQDLEVQRENQMNTFISNLINRTSDSLMLLSVLIVALMTFGMYNSIKAVVNDSKNEILIFRSIGASKSQIIRKFLYESIIVSLLGGLIGAFGGIFLCYATTYMIYLIIPIYISPIFNPIFIFISILIAVFAGLIGGIIPSYSITKKKFWREVY